MTGNLHGCCVKCGKNGGILYCNGCEQTLCFKHVNEHRNELEKDLENLIHEENQFELNLSKIDETSELFQEIDQWRKSSIEQIKQIAKQAKQDLKDLLFKSNEDLLNKSKLIQINLHLLKESDDFNEKQFKDLINQFNSLKKQINSFRLIKSYNSNFIQIEKESTQSPPPPPSLPIIEKPLFNLEEIHSNQQGSVIISFIDPYGYFITIQHTGRTTTKDEDMVGWTLKRSIDSYQEFIYQFPNEFILKANSSIKILSKQASLTLYSYDKANCLVADLIQTWGTSIKTSINTLLDAKGDQRDVFTQTFK
ncbi:hypothetical protein I4U23_021765 [Adineta vaga]|nr:hypothetical protein I4U23_021765 [Adineta vaga]